MAWGWMAFAFAPPSPESWWAISRIFHLRCWLVKLTLCCNIMLVNWIIPLSRPCTGMVKSEPAKFDRTVHLPYPPAATLLLLPCSASTSVRVFTHENNPDMVKKAIRNVDIVAEWGLKSHSTSLTRVQESPPNRAPFFRDAKRNLFAERTSSTPSLRTFTLISRSLLGVQLNGRTTDSKRWRERRERGGKEWKAGWEDTEFARLGFLKRIEVCLILLSIEPLCHKMEIRQWLMVSVSVCTTMCL